MKNLWLVFILAAFLSIGMLIACGGGGDDDDAADDDAADDDIADDDIADDDTADDDIGGDLFATNVDQSECKDDAEAKDIWNPQTDPTNVVQVTWEDGVLKIDDLFAYVNCCAELEVEVEAAGNNITITESDVGELCDCTCPIDFHYEIEDVSAANVSLTVLRDDPETSGTFTVVEIVLDLGKQNKSWFIPFVEVMGYFGGSSSSDPVTLTYAACNLFNAEDQQLYVQNVGNNYIVYGYDWMDLDNPGNFEPACQIPVQIDLGTLASGSYFFAAPGHNDDDGWYLKTPEPQLVMP